MFYDNYIELCLKREISPSAAAEDMGLSAAHVYKWKKGATPIMQTLKTIAAYFGVTAEYLLEDRKIATVVGDDDTVRSDYDRLTDDNKELINQMIAKLIASQSQP